MARSAFVLGSGQIGRAVARALADSGWQVTCCDRRVADRRRKGELEAAVGAGADVLVDTVAFDERDAMQLTGLASVLGSVVVISSASVYRDDRGRTLDEATREEELPALPVPVSESHPLSSLAT